MSQQTRRLLSSRSLAGALWKILAPGASAFFLVSSGVAVADPLESVTAPVSKTIETITAPVTGSLPPPPSVSTPPPVQIPVVVPVRPPTLPATRSLEPVTSTVGSTATAPVASPTLSKTVAAAQNGAATVAGSAAEIAGEVTGAAGESGAPVRVPRKGPTAEALPGVAATAASGDRGGGDLKTARAAPLGDWLVRIWPAVALGRSTLDVFLDGWPQIALRIVEQGGTATFGAGDAGGGSGSGGDGLGDLASSVDLPSPGRWFVPDTPLPLAVVYVALAGGLGAIWCLSRREVSRRTVPRRRRL